MLNSRKSATTIGIFHILLKNVFSLLLTPLMILVFGKQDFGVYKIVLSLTAYFMLLDLGVHNVSIRYISKFRNEKNYENQNKYTGMMQVFYLLSSAVTIITSTIIYFLVPFLFKKSLQNEEIFLFKQIFVVLTANSCFSLIFNPYIGIIKAYEKFLFFKGLQLLKVIIRSFFIYILLINNFKVLEVVAADTSINLFYGIINYLFIRFKLRIKPTLENVTFNEIKELFSYSFFIFINMVALQLFWASDNVILGIMTSSTVVAVYSIGTMINSYFQSFAGAFSEFLLPHAVKMIGNNDKMEKISIEMARIGRYILFSLGLITMVFAFFGKKFIFLWLGRDFSTAYWVALIVMIPQLFTYTQYFGASIMWAKGKHKKRSIIMLFVAIMNIFITIILVEKIGMIGAAIGTSFAYIAGYLIYTTLYYHYTVGINMPLFFKDLFKSVWKAIIPAFAIFYIIKQLFFATDWGTFILQCSLSSLFYLILLYFLAMNKKEKNIVRMFMAKIKGETNA